MFLKALMRVAVNWSVPFAKYVPFGRDNGRKIDNLLNNIISTRRKENFESGEKKKDLLQIFIDNHESHPTEFTEQHLRESMNLFM